MEPGLVLDVVFRERVVVLKALPRKIRCCWFGAMSVYAWIFALALRMVSLVLTSRVMVRICVVRTPWRMAVFPFKAFTKICMAAMAASALNAYTNNEYR